MKVMKFGGTSVGSAARMKNVASLINDGEDKIVVLSAMSGTTNSLVEISKSNCKLLSFSVDCLLRYHRISILSSFMVIIRYYQLL